MTGFYMKCNTGLKRVKDLAKVKLNFLDPKVFVPLQNTIMTGYFYASGKHKETNLFLNYSGSIKTYS